MDAPTDVGPGPTPGSPPPSGSPTGGPGPRRLRRRPDDGHIAGVCAGVAEYFNVDPVIVRIAAVVLAFSGPGLGAYILAWIFVPEAHGPIPYGAPQPPIDRKDRGTQIFGIVLLALAVSLIWGDWWSPARRWMFPIGLIALGGWLLLRRDADDDDLEPSPPVPPTPAWGWTPAAATSAVDAPTDEPTTDDDTATGADPTLVTDLGGPTGDDDATTVFADPTTELPEADGADGGPPRAPWDVPPVPVPPVPPDPPSGPHWMHGWHGPHRSHRRRRRSIVGPIVFGALLVWAGLAWMGGVSVETSLAVGLLIIGTGFILGSFMGGSRALILPALVVGSALAVTAVVDIPLHGPIGDQRWAPQTVDDLQDSYEVSIGEGTLDLRGVDLDRGDRIGLDASVGIGHLVILVANDVAVEVDTRVGAGEAKVFGLDQNGVGISADQQDDGRPGAGTFVLDLEVGLGQVEVHRAGGGSSTTSTTRPLG